MYTKHAIRISLLVILLITTIIQTQLKQFENSLAFYANPTAHHGIEIVLDDKTIRDLPQDDHVITLLQQLTHAPEKILAAHRALTIHKKYTSMNEEFEYTEKHRLSHPLLPFYEHPAESSINRQDSSCLRTLLEHHILETVEQRTQNQPTLTYTSYASRGKFSDIVLLSRLVRDLKKQIIINLIDHNFLLSISNDSKNTKSVHHTTITQNIIPLYYAACMLEWLNRTLKGNCKLFLYTDENDYTHACLKNEYCMSDILVGIDYIKPQYESHLPLQRLAASCLKNNGLLFSLSKNPKQKNPIVRSLKKIKPVPQSVIARIARAYDIESNSNAAVLNNYVADYLESLTWDLNDDCCNQSLSWCSYFLYVLRYLTSCFSSSSRHKHDNKIH